MNERTKLLAEQAKEYSRSFTFQQEVFEKKFAELIVNECASICEDMAAKCAGLEGDGALAKDCAYWIKKDFGVEE